MKQCCEWEWAIWVHAAEQISAFFSKQNHFDKIQNIIISISMPNKLINYASDERRLPWLCLE